MQVSVPQALAFRLARQHLTAPAGDAVTAARAVLGAQAQVQSAAILQLRARTAAGFAAAAAEGALWRDRSLVKLWGHRSTLHLMAREDVALLRAVRRLAIGGYHAWYAKGGLTPDQVDLLVQAVRDTLAGHGPHSRMDLSRRLVPVLGEWARPWLEHSWGGVIKLACALGHVCHGPPLRPGADGDAGGAAAGEEREAKFVHLPDWLGPVWSGGGAVPGGTVQDGATALPGLVRRYLSAFGPATAADIRKFTGLPAGPVAAALAALGPDLMRVDLAGRSTYLLARDEAVLREAEPTPGAITIIPLFDPWLLGHVDTGQYLDDRFRPAVYRTAGWISPVVLRQGRVIATWTHRRTVKGWDVTVTPLERVWKKDLPAITRALRHLAGEDGLANVRLAGA
ncbi:MAG: hypothetical protein RLY86_3422 [Pseudomonadota bacterium]|jgi:hypothetical protein